MLEIMRREGNLLMDVCTEEFMGSVVVRCGFNVRMLFDTKQTIGCVFKTKSNELLLALANVCTTVFASVML